MANKQMKGAQPYWQSGKSKLKPLLGEFHTHQVHEKITVALQKTLELPKHS